MVDVPEDIRATAKQVRDIMWIHSSPTLALNVVAGAILAERERCAKIAEGYNIPALAERLETSWAINSTAQEIAAAIRKQS